MSKLIVAIVGSQNVGKSTLLNRLTGRRISIVEDLPGTTRDRVFAEASWNGRDFTVVDTGGLDTKESFMAQRVKEQIETAIADADLIVFMVDVKAGITPADTEMAQMLRQSKKPVIVVVNKADNDRLEQEAVEFYKLGLEEPLPVSAFHGRNTAELLDKIVSLLPETPPEPPVEEGLKIAIAGRPGVGKSTLLNTLVGKNRAIVGETPGTTRDSVDIRIDFDGQSVLLIDTAGIRRGKVEVGIETYSVMRALKSIERADVVLLLLDSTEMITAQDLHVAGYVQEAVKGVVVVVNKWDLVTEKNTAEATTYIRSQLKFMTYAPVIYISAKTGKGTDQILPLAQKVYRERNRRISTPEVNSIVQQAVAAHTLPRKGSKQLKIHYATQAEVNPPTFVFFVNDSKLVHFSYRRYLENKVREKYGFEGTPLKFVFKNREAT